MLKQFIERPVLSTVISIIIVTLGILGLVSLPISQYPDIAPPTIQVQASYSGANADVVLKSVVVPLEQQINGVENMDYITSTAGNDGSANITVSFKIGSDPNMAAVNVQNAVSRATPLLPQEVTKAGVTVQKKQTSTLLILSLYSVNPSFDQKFLQNYADINVLPVIKRIQGVGDASSSSSMDYSMRIWLNTQAMASYGLVPADVTAALADQNIQAAPGQFGEQGGQSFQYIIKYPGTLVDPDQFGEIVLRSNARSRLLRLKDIARIELGAQSYFNSSRTNGRPAVSVNVSQVAGSNAHQVIQETLTALDEASKSFPDGVRYVVLQNVDDFLNASIDKVLHTLLEAFILVFVVVFLFLQDFRSTLIPAISVPVAIVGTFFFLKLFGFTINLLTLFATILAIGIVVDDAIVVVEAVHAKLDEGYESAELATVDALSEISKAIISITLVMSAVFIPVSFIGGSSGIFYKQFGLTLAIAIVLSAINALTLSPALCALFLKPHGEEHHKKNFIQRFYAAFNAAFEAISKRYVAAIRVFAKRKWIPLGGLVLFVVLLVLLAKHTPTGFVPNEDLGAINCNISLPPDASLERADAVARKIEGVAKTVPEINNVLTITGRGQLSGTGNNYATVVMRLIPWDQRKRDIQVIIKELFAKTANITEAEIKFFAPPTIQGFGATNGFAFQLQDKTGGSIAVFYKVSHDFLSALGDRSEIQFATTSFNPNFPMYLMNVNVPKIKEAGLNVTDITGAMQGYYGGIYASNFNEFGQQYRVIVQASPEYRLTPESMNSVFVRTPAGAMVPVTEFVTLTQDYGPQSITRFNLFNSISVNGTPNAAYSSGQAIEAIQQVAAQTLPAGYSYEYSGITREELAGGSQTIFIFMLCLVFVYLLLSAQYESYVLPLAILLTIPVGIAGAFLFVNLFGISNNIYVQITLIMLIGLLAKNAILIVEFAVERRKSGMDIVEAAVKGAQARLRPILMTSFAFILGLVPLMLATGAGANGNRSIGTGAVGGMLIGTTFGLFITPVLFILLQTLQEKVSKKKRGAVSGGIQMMMLGAVVVLVASCSITRPYQAPGSAVKGLYRDVDTADTATMASLHWQELFTDTLLRRLIAKGIAQNLDLRAAYSRTRQAAAYYQQSRQQFLPAVNGDASADYLGSSNQQVLGKTVTAHSYQAELTASWEADIWGKLRSAKRASLAGMLQAEANARAVQTSLVASIANAYYSLLALDQQLVVTQESVKSWQKTVDIMKELKKANVVTGAAVVQSEASKYAAAVTIPDLKQSIRETENQLNLLLGNVPGPIARARLEGQHPVELLQTGVPAQLLANRPDVQAAEYNLRYYFEQTNVARTYFYPALTISAAGGYSSLTSFFGAGSWLSSLTAGLSQPIFAQGANRTRLRVSQEQQQQAALSFQTTLLTAGEDVSNALYSYQMAKEKEETRTSQLDNLQKSVDYTQELVRYNFANYTEVLTAEQSLLAAQLNQVSDRLQQLQSVVYLYRALGGGWR